MEIQVEKEDIQIIGHTAYEEDGNTTIICDSKYDGFSYLFLKNILKCFGPYEIIDSYELFADEQDILSVTDRVFKTNLPFKDYLATTGTFDWVKKENL